MSPSERRLALDWTRAHDVKPLEKSLSEALPHLVRARAQLLEGTGAGAEFTGWVRYAQDLAPRALKEMKRNVEDVCGHSDAVVVVGIGGSLLGTKAVYEALTHSFALMQRSELHRRPLLLFAGHHLASDELVELLDALDHLTPTIVVVSKSGGTTEPALAFRILKQYMDFRFGSAESTHRIFAITDPESGTLLQVSRELGYARFPIPRNVGGRYSVFTPVGLFPLACAGIDVEALVQGAADATNDCTAARNDSWETNPALCYAGLRNALYKEGFKIESLCVWTPKLGTVCEWWKQLFGESDGKDRSGLFPASARFTTDLHSMGQYFQEGERSLFATHVRIADEGAIANGSVKRNLKIPSPRLADGFDFLTGTDLAKVQRDAQDGTFIAHADGGVPTLAWEWPELSAYWLGYWMYTNMFACAVGGYARGVNPFDQPGVESYKLNMFALAGNPKHQAKANDIKARLESGRRLRSIGISTGNG